MDASFDIYKLADAILVELQKVQPDAGWFDTSKETWKSVARKDGLGVDFSVEWNRPDFIKVRGDVKEHGTFRLPYKESYGHIFVRADRGAQAIAKEIIRRLLPTWEPVYLEGIKLAADDKAYENGKQATFQRLLALGGKDWSYSGSKEPRVRFGHITLQVSSPGNVTLDGHLYLTEEIVSDIVKLLQEKHPEFVA